MSLTTMMKRSAVALGVALGLSSAGCSRDHIEAINLANEGDQAVSVNPEGAIQKYEQAIQLDPTSHQIMWKLAKAYEKKEDWDKMASTLSRLVCANPPNSVVLPPGVGTAAPTELPMRYRRPRSA